MTTRLQPDGAGGTLKHDVEILEKAEPTYDLPEAFWKGSAEEASAEFRAEVIAQIRKVRVAGGLMTLLLAERAYARYVEVIVALAREVWTEERPPAGFYRMTFVDIDGDREITYYIEARVSYGINCDVLVV